MERAVIVIICLFFSHLSTAIADAKIDRYGALAKYQSMAVSPDGEKIAFRTVDSNQDIVSIISVNPKALVASVDVSSVKPNNVDFITNDYLVLKVSDQARIFGYSEFEASTAMAYDIKKNSIKQILTPGKDNVYIAQQGLGSIVGVSPDLKYVYMPAFSGKPQFINGQQLDIPLGLFKAKLNGNRVRLYKSGIRGTRNYFLNDEGDVIAREVFDESKNRHSVYSLVGKKSVQVFSENTPYITKSFIGIDINEENLIMIDSNRETGRDAVYKVSLVDGDTEGPLYEKEHADIVSYISDPQKKIIGLRYSGFNPSYTFFDSDLNQRVKDILAEFTGHAVWIIDVSPNRDHVLVYLEGAQSSGDYFLFSKGKQLRYIASSRPGIPPEDVHPVGVVTFKARDGLSIPTLLTIPKGKIENVKNLPTVVIPHGGPGSSDQNGFDYLAQAFADQGYLVLQPQFRGSTGLGYEHQAAGYGEWGRKMQNDITDTVIFFSKQEFVNPERVCIVGASYGGYAALAGGAFTPELYKCVVSINGVGNLKSFQSWIKYEQGRSSASYAFWQAQIRGFDSSDNANYTDRSPEVHVDSFQAPTLIVYSQNDTIVPPRQSITMYNALKKANKSVEIIELKGDDHNLSNADTRLEALRATVAFVNKNI